MYPSKIIWTVQNNFGLIKGQYINIIFVNFFIFDISTASVSDANIEEDQSVIKKDFKSVEVAELDTIEKQNLDKNAHFNGNNYETAIYIVLGLCLAFIVLIVVLLAMYFYSRKKTVTLPVYLFG